MARRWGRSSGAGNRLLRPPGELDGTGSMARKRRVSRRARLGRRGAGVSQTSLCIRRRWDRLRIRFACRRRACGQVLRESEGPLISTAELLRCRVRYFSDGLILGGRSFIERMRETQPHSRFFSQTARPHQRPLRGGDWGGSLQRPPRSCAEECDFVVLPVEFLGVGEGPTNFCSALRAGRA